MLCGGITENEVVLLLMKLNSLIVILGLVCYNRNKERDDKLCSKTN